MSHSRKGVLLCLWIGIASCCQGEDAARQWGQWRGPLATGEAPHAKPPVQWDGESGKNVRWSTPLPGRGHSTPVAWGTRIYLTAAQPVGDAFPPRRDNAPGSHDNLPVTHRHEFLALAVDRATGKILWQRKLHEAIPHEGAHYSASLASASPITDGERIVAYFGSYGLYCLDADGKLLWKKQLGVMNTKHGHGEGSTPVLHGDTLVVNWDHEGGSFIVALDARDGKEIWRRKRNEVTSWATPVVAHHNGASQVIVSGTSRVRSYDLTTGQVLWECGGLSANIVASPVARDGMVFAASSYDTKAMLAIRLAGAQGDITNTEQVVWSRRRSTPYVPSPLLYRNAVYYLSHYQGVLSRLVAKTGDEPSGPFRLGGIRNVYASPVAADGRIYVVDRDGLTLVISADESPDVLALNRIDDTFNASPAVIGDCLLLRGERRLWCLAKAPGTVSADTSDKESP